MPYLCLDLSSLNSVQKNQHTVSIFFISLTVFIYGSERNDFKIDQSYEEVIDNVTLNKTDLVIDTLKMYTDNHN